MTDDASPEVTETCRCGAAITLRGIKQMEAFRRVTAWRKDHYCLTAAEAAVKDAADVPQRTGAGSHIGFAGKWDHDTREPIT